MFEFVTVRQETVRIAHIIFSAYAVPIPDDMIFAIIIEKVNFFSILYCHRTMHAYVPIMLVGRYRHS